MKTERECLEELRWFLNKEAVFGIENCFGIKLSNGIKLSDGQVLVYYYNPLADTSLIFGIWDGPKIIKIIRQKQYPTQKPIRVNYLGANSNDDEIFYLLNEPEAKAEYERQLLLEATKENAVNKTTSKRKI